jgi:hypothetical protein
MIRITGLCAASAMLAAVVACGCGFASAAADDDTAPGAAAVARAPSTDRDAVLLVVAPRSLADAMAPLVAHKTKTGMPARLVEIESLDHGAGRDDAERVKHAIFESHEKHGTRYVLLAGDASLFPVRFRMARPPKGDTDEGCTYEPTDLYYSNLYRDHAPGNHALDPTAIVHSAKFDDWDADGDGAFDAQHAADDAASFDPDHVDGCPDVAVGRLPAHAAEEATAHVDKVIRYETENYHDKLQLFAVLADRECPESMSLCDVVAGAATARRFLLNCRSSDDAQAPWKLASFGTIGLEVRCSGWIVYVGHASALAWQFHEAGRNFDAPLVSKFRGGDPLRGSVFAVGGETGRFTGRRSGVARPGCYDGPDARDRTFACSWLTASGGAIVYAGESQACPSDMGAELLKNVLAGRSGKLRILGDLWIEGQRRYWLDNRASECVFRSPRIYLGIMTLFGDPSVRIPGRERTAK